MVGHLYKAIPMETNDRPREYSDVVLTAVQHNKFITHSIARACSAVFIYYKLSASSPMVQKHFGYRFVITLTDE